MKFQHKITLSLLLAIVLCGVAFAQVVEIPDPNLRRAVREALNLPNDSQVTVQSIRQLTELKAQNAGIESLDGLEYAENLIRLWIGSNPLSDLSPISNCSKLEDLDVSGCGLSDISALQGLVNLLGVNIGGNSIHDLQPLNSLKNLEHLLMYQNPISDITPLANLRKLKRLWAWSCRISDISALQDLSELTELNLAGNQIVDITPLDNLTQMKRLSLDSNRIADVSPLASLTLLEWLEIQKNYIVDHSPLDSLSLDHFLYDQECNIVLGGTAFGQVVEIPDLNLRRAVREALNLPNDSQVTVQDIRQLMKLKARNAGIESLDGLEYAANLRRLWVGSNPLSDLLPISNCCKLEDLDVSGCGISDISALRNLSELTELNLAGNQIVDVAPLGNLTKITRLSLNRNRITDVIPLASLTRLTRLEIQNNYILDHSPLDSLSLDHFLYDQECNIPPFPLEARLEHKTYPSPYAAEWTYGIDPRLDLVLGYILDDFGVRHQNDGRVVGNLEYAMQKRNELMATNPNMVFLVNISMRGEGIDHYGEDWPFWIRDGSGNIVLEGITEGAGLMDFTHPVVQDIIVEQAIAVSKCGLFDGIVFDWWHETGSILADRNSGWLEGYRGLDAEQRARDVILQRIRAETRPNFLIQVNSNRGKIPRTAPFINGLTMETGIPNWFSTEDALNNALLETESTLSWAEENLREPRITGVAGEALYGEAEDSANNRRWARVLLTLSLTHADGYAVYQTHASWGKSTWIDLFEADLGHPVGPKSQLYDEDNPGLYIREFTNGWAVYNRSGAQQVVTLPEEVRGVDSGVVNTEHTLPNLDGEMYLRVKPVNPADVNGDGVVNILDLTLVAQGFGTDGLAADVNGDGVVNVFDLVFVAGEMQ